MPHDREAIEIVHAVRFVGELAPFAQRRVGVVARGHEARRAKRTTDRARTREARRELRVLARDEQRKAGDLVVVAARLAFMLPGFEQPFLDRIVVDGYEQIRAERGARRLARSATSRQRDKPHRSPAVSAAATSRASARLYELGPPRAEIAPASRRVADIHRDFFDDAENASDSR